MKRIPLLFIAISISIPAAERPPQPPTRTGTLALFPADVHKLILPYLTGDTLEESIANIKRYYIAYTPSQRRVDVMQAILSYLMDKFNLDYDDFRNVVHKLQKLKSITVFRNPEMHPWMRQRVTRLYNEKKLLTAISSSNLNEIERLIAQGVNVNARAINGWTYLMIAIIPNQIRAIELLLAAGARVNEKTKSGGTALMEASRINRIEILERLIAAGADVNAANDRGDTALIIAAANGHPEIVRRLLAAGADPCIRNRNSESALETARRNITRVRGRFEEQEYNEIIQMLREREPARSRCVIL